MDCTEAKTLLLARRRASLDADARAQVDAHLAECAACRHEDAADAQLSMLLEKRLPRPDAPASLKRALEERWIVPARPRKMGRIARTSAAMAVGAALAIAGLYAWHARAPDDALVAEAVNDHLRVLYSDHPLEVESGGIHRVKPWFEGRLDFAPVAAPVTVGAAEGSIVTLRGFHVISWRQGDLGYALVSDANEGDLRTLATKIAGP